MLLIEGNHPIEAVAPGGPNEAFAVCVCLRRAHRRSQHLQRHRIERVVGGSRKDAVAIVDEEAIAGMKREAIPKLLDRPFSGGIGGEVRVHHSTCGNVEDDKDVDPLKRGGHDQEAVAREHIAGMVVKKGRPRLR